MMPAEQAVNFACHGEQLTGIVSVPSQPGPLGVVIIVGGPQVRTGSHRQFVLLARALAAAGFATLRFDNRGMGDSEGAQRSFEHITDDIAAAINALQKAQPSVQQVVLWGLCDGASAALLYLHAKPDPRVAGLALLNPWVRSAASLARTHVKHYYLQRLQQRDFWAKLCSGKVALGALTGLLHNVRAAFGGARSTRLHSSANAPYQQRMALAWAAFTGATLLLLSEQDLTAREFTEFTATSAPWQQAFAQQPPARITLTGADHTCSAPASQHAMQAATVQWLTTLNLPGA